MKSAPMQAKVSKVGRRHCHESIKTGLHSARRRDTD